MLIFFFCGALPSAAATAAESAAGKTAAGETAAVAAAGRGGTAVPALWY